MKELTEVEKLDETLKKFIDCGFPINKRKKTYLNDLRLRSSDWSGDVRGRGKGIEATL